MINCCCDWCGAYVHCPMCEDPAAYGRDKKIVSDGSLYEALP
jgi:hypothetical protein